jgi:RHS repeat-associated protein
MIRQRISRFPQVIRCRIATALLLLVALPAFSQTPPTANTFRPDRGFHPTGTYALTDVESVNATNGVVALSFPLARTAPGRNGSSFPLTLSYGSAIFNTRTQPGNEDYVNEYDTQNQVPAWVDRLEPVTDHSSGGWKYNYRWAIETDVKGDCPSYTPCIRQTLTTGDGGSHTLWLRVPVAAHNDSDGYSIYYLTGKDATGTYNIGPTLTYYTTDGSFIRVEVTVATVSSAGTWRAIMPNGDYVSGPIVWPGYQKEANQICDRNGNCTQIQNEIDSQTGLVALTRLIDPVGRQVLLAHSNPTLLGTGIDEIRVLPVGADVSTSGDPTGKPNVPVTKVYWKHIFFGAFFPSATNGMIYECREPSTLQSYTCIVNHSIRVVEKIELPVGLNYDFLYADSTAAANDRAMGELLEMKLPSKTGESVRASVKYTWSRREQLISGSSPTPWFDANINPLASKVLTYQEEESDSKTRSWTYNVQATQSTITAPDGGQTQHYFYARDAMSWNRGLVYRITEPAGNTWRCWQFNEPWIGVATTIDPKNPYIKAEYRSLAGGTNPVSASVLDYDKNGNLMTRLEYSWVSTPSDDPSCTVSGTVLRKTENRYWNPPGGAGSPVRAATAPTAGLTNAYWSYTANTKRDSLLESRGYAGNEANPSNAKSLAQFTYDNPNTTGNVLYEYRWNSVLAATPPAEASTGVTLSGSTAAVTSRTYVSGQNGLLDTVTDPRNMVTKYQYAVVQSQPSGGSCPSSYQNLYPTTITVGYGQGDAQQHDYRYDCATGVLTHDIFASNQNTRTSYTYDYYGRVTQEAVAAEQSDPTRKRVTSFEYEDGYRRVRTVQDGKLGVVYHFTQLGELFRTRENTDGASSPISASGTDGFHSVTLGRTVSNDAHYTITSTPFTYPASDTESTMGWTREKLDKAGRVIEVKHYRGAEKPAPFGNNTQVTGTRSVANSGYTTQVTDEANKLTSTVVNALGRIESATNPAGTTYYTYNVLDNLTGVTQSDAWTYGSQKTQTRTYTYNSLGWLLSASNPEMSGAINYTYFPNGALQTRTDARSVTLTNTLDILGRVTKTDYSTTDPVTPNLRFCYDGKEYNLSDDNCVAVGGRSDHARGALTHAVARVSGSQTIVSGTKYRSIDPLGRVRDSRQTTGDLSDYTFLYQYALGGALAEVQYPSGNRVSYDINGANRISRVRKGQSGSSYYMQNAAYNPAGALVGATLGLDGANQWTESRIYNSRLQARRVEVTKGASTLLRLRWAYSGAYNTTTLEETGSDNNGDLRVERLEHLHQSTLQSVDRSYYYTGADRLSYFSETSGKSQWFGHDAFGNVWQTSAYGVPALRQTGSSWYLSGSTVNNRLANTTYDEMGNQTQLSVSAGTVASYDGENRMSRIKVGTTEIASYTYDAEGRRVAKTANGATTYYFYDAFGQLMAEYGGPAQTAATHYFTTDYLGSTRMILNATGGCVERLDYAPFGGQIARTGQDCYGGASNNKPLFTGQMRDGESNAGTDTGQDYFNARYFWANTARFTSPDAPFADQRPEDGQSWNMYAYVRNNPLRYVDPSGACSRSADGGYTDEGDELFKGKCSEGIIGGNGAGIVVNVPENRDEVAAAQAEHNRMQYEARRRAQREAEQKEQDQELGEKSKAVITVAYYRTAHNLDCAGLSFINGSVEGGYAYNGREVAGFRSPVTGRLVGGYKSAAPPGAAQGSSTFSWRMREALSWSAGRKIPGAGGASTFGAAAGRIVPKLGFLGAVWNAFQINACLSE